MPIYPKVQSPCPYKSDLAAVMDGDFCRMCERQVFDLTQMSDGERFAFMAGCAEDEICVSYRVPLRPAIAAAALAAATVAMPGMAAAQEVAPVAPVAAEAPATDAVQPADAQTYVIIVGGIHDPGTAEFVENPTDVAMPEMPVAYEDDPAAPAPVTGPARPAGKPGAA
jgi:predicted Fe-S protein YdhL (DUF1289 family)